MDTWGDPWGPAGLRTGDCWEGTEQRTGSRAPALTELCPWRSGSATYWPEACWVRGLKPGPVTPKKVRAWQEVQMVPCLSASVQAPHLFSKPAMEATSPEIPATTHQHIREHQGSQRPAMHSRVPD